MTALTAILAAILVAALVMATASDDAQAQTAPRVLGAFIGKQAVGDAGFTGDDPSTEISAFANKVGAPPRVVMWYQPWGRTDGRQFFNFKGGDGTGIMDEVVAKGAMPMVTWTPQDPAQGTNQTTYALRKIIAGQHDAYIKQWAQDAKAWGKPFYLRFGHEMNGNWNSWSPGVNGNKAGEYAAAWKRVHDIFRKEGVTNVRWVWSPNVEYNAAWRHVHTKFKEAGATNVRWVWSPYVSCGNCTGFGQVYPGNAYVDWVALDGYNWGGSSWQSMSQVFATSYDKVTALAPTKPFMIAEISSAESGGSKANWITSAYYQTIISRMPKTQAIVWFDSIKERDWRVNSSATSLAAYQKVAKDPSYQGRLP